ncbi:RGD1 [[Candida] subhashii]|uniref:RGD1 n=1 Tax=[Candida] subhashii TaxID=561895 RepID=A0A8J5QCS6_9ASCO|nr:RGD1 [[Candida] subhashii]KAG7660403.1 RGD1 [[Candida] subhashii]
MPESIEPSEASKLLNEDPKIQSILSSDTALEVLLTRLKQSINTSDEFAKFIKKKALVEDDHYTQLKKFASNTRNIMKSNKNLKQDSLQDQLDKIIQFDEILYGVGNSFVRALNTMYDELIALIGTVSRSRKLIKDEGRRKEKEFLDSIQAAEKAKLRYDHLCEDLEKLKTSDPNKKSFSLKNKSLEQQEDDLQRKVDSADQDYKSKVSTCKKLKDEILIIHRPNNSKKLKNLILELDIALNVQLQKYATWNENLIMNSGVLISPLQSTKPSMKQMASSIDNEKDLYQYLLRYGSSSGSNKNLTTVEYQVHPSLIRAQPNKPFLSGNKLNNTKPLPNNNFGNNNNNTNTAAAHQRSASSIAFGTGSKSSYSPTGVGAAIGGAAAGVGAAMGSGHAPSKSFSMGTPTSPEETKSYAPYPSNADDSLPVIPSSDAPIPQEGAYQSLDPLRSGDLNGPKSLSPVAVTQPTFGVSIEDVIEFAGVDNVPLIVRKCIEVIEAYGLNIVGIYRTSSNSTTVSQLKQLIDEKFTNYLLIGKDINPDNVYDSEIFAVASLLKLYFASLPEPLFTNEMAPAFIDTVKSTDETYIAKKLHHLVFSLPDGAYFSLRALIFHLNNVAKYERDNRMNAKSLSIIWGPVLFNELSSNVQDLSYKSKVVEELMAIANDIFETEDE